jgi:adenylate cyclase
VSPPPEPRAPVAEGAVVFTDIIGFTEFTAMRGDEDALRLLARHETTVRASLPAGARLVKDLGDGFLLWFPDVRSALDAMLRLQDALESETPDEEWPLWIRVGVHWGRPLRRGDDLVGHDVNVASRIVDVAGPGEVLVSDACVCRVDDGLPNMCFEELGPVAMKGLPEPIGLYRATWARDLTSSRGSAEPLRPGSAP